MKQIILCVCLLLGVLCSCDKKPINGKLDGRWQLMTIEYNDGSIKECERIYCSIQLHLVELMDKGTTPLTLIGHFSSADGGYRYRGGFEQVWAEFFRHTFRSGKSNRQQNDSEIRLCPTHLSEVLKQTA